MPELHTLDTRSLAVAVAIALSFMMYTGSSLLSLPWLCNLQWRSFLVFSAFNAFSVVRHCLGSVLVTTHVMTCCLDQPVSLYAGMCKLQHAHLLSRAHISKRLLWCSSTCCGVVCSAHGLLAKHLGISCCVVYKCSCLCITASAPLCNLKSYGMLPYIHS